MGVTIKEVAEYVGVSRGTVDRVLHKRGNVKKEIEQKVLRALDELDYAPNASARALALSQNAPKIGVLIPNQPGFFHDEVRRGISRGQEECRALGVELLVEECDANAPAEYIRVIDRMCEEGVKGFAISAQNSQLLIEKIDQLDAGDIPVVTLNSDIPASRRRAFVGEDAYKSGRIAGELVGKMLQSDGEILIVGGRPEFDAHVSRVKGFQDCVSVYSPHEIECKVIYTYEIYPLTYDRILEELSECRELCGIYLSASCVSAYVDALNRVKPSKRPLAVCHDVPADTLGYLKEGSLDFTIEQNIFRQGYKPIQLLRDHILYGKEIYNDNIKPFYNIISSECIL